jgi:uncharacterized membrane protein
MSSLNDLQDTEKKLLQELRDLGRQQRTHGKAPDPPLTIGQTVADMIAAGMGSWTFIICQSVFLAAWIVLNIIAVIRHWDPYPFILLNLFLSFQAAYAAPFIMMSQNRQQDIDRRKAEGDYKVNVKAELEIELLHQKLDEMREKEIALLTQTVADLTNLLKSSGVCADDTPAIKALGAKAAAATAPVAKAAAAKTPAAKKPAAKKPAAKKPAKKS